MSKKQKFINLSLILLLPLVMVGCSKSIGDRAAEKVIESSTGGNVKVDSSNGEVQITTDQGNIKTGADIELPSDFPDDIYIAEGKILSFFNSVEGEGRSLNINSGKSVKEISEIYQKEVVSDGWKIESSMMAGESSIFSTKKGNRVLSIMISPYTEGEGSLITIVEAKE